LTKYSRKNKHNKVQRGMNPGTTIIIIIGIISFLLYLSKAFKQPIKERFQVMGDDDIKYRSDGNIFELTKNTQDFNKLISSFKTPDFDLDRPIGNFKPNTIPTPITNAVSPTKTIEKPVVMPTKITNTIPTTVSNVGTTLPANVPSSLLNSETPVETTPPPEPFVSKSSLSPDNTEEKPKQKIVYVPRKCPPMPDMSQYIRKDSIPCWGCNLR